MTEREAIRLTQAYSAEYDVRWVGILRTWKSRAWWFVQILEYRFEIDTGGEGTAFATVDTQMQRVTSFEFLPKDLTRFRLPLWAAYPLYNAVTTGWREGNGEHYLHAWYDWYASLSDIHKSEYRRRYPEPKWGAWEGFYERCSLWSK